MIDFIQQLKYRNETLFYFGLICFVLSITFFVLTYLTKTEVYGVNAWHKPFKFAVSLGIYSWTMAWYCYYLPNFNISLFNWTVVILWSFEIIYIAFQAGKGQQSHYNLSTPIYSVLYGLMAIAATIETFICTHSTYAMTLKDGWTMVGNKGGFMAQHEHTIVVTDNKPIILTEKNEIWN